MRLPKPIATGVRFQSRALGSVYTAAQMKAYAAKAVEAEREACAKVCEDAISSYVTDSGGMRLVTLALAAAIRSRGEVKP